MPTRHRKVRKLRGSRTHGWGIQGQHRCKGMKGGTGKAGIHKHKWNQDQPRRTPKVGFTSRQSKAPPKNTINVGELDQLIQTFLAQKLVSKTKTGVKLDLEKLGYQKLLGRGKITQPLHVSVPSRSEQAAAKIEAAGGKVNPSTKQ